MFNSIFIVTAFIVGIMLGIIIPILGLNITVKNLSMTGDTLSHTALTGVALGLVLGVNPLLISLIVCIIANIIIEFIRKKYKKYADVSLAIIFSIAIGLAGILSSFTSSVNFNSYLFGSIGIISDMDLILCSVVFAITILFSAIFSKQIFYCQYNEQDAKISGVNVSLINFAMSTLTAMVVAISSKTIGSLVVSSLLVLPVVTSMQLFKSYKFTMLSSIMFSISSVIIGLIIAYYANTRPGATIVMVSAIIFIIVLVSKSIVKFVKKRKSIKANLMMK